MLVLILSLGLLQQAGKDLEAIGSLADKDLREVSGIVKSRTHPGIFWVHNDSNNTNDVYAITLNGKTVRKVRAPFFNVDWEDIATDAKGRLYVADTGNNAHRLPIRTIYRITEPDPKSDQRISKSEACFYQFGPEGRFDCESLVVVDETVYLITKRLDGREAELYALPFNPASTLFKPATPQRVRAIPGFKEPATGADLTQDQRFLAICSPQVSRVYSLETPGRLTLVGEVRYKERQVEAICWDGLDLILTDELGHLFRIREAVWSNAKAPEKSGEGRRSR